MPNMNDMPRGIDYKFGLLIQKILQSSENPSQDEMDEIVELFSEIEAACNETGIDPSNLAGYVKKK